MRPKTCTLLLSMLTVIASPFAMADALVNVKTEVVRFDDLRLISNVGAAVLYGRLNNASQRACGGPHEGPQQLAHKQRYDACVKETLEKAVADVNHPILTHFYETKQKTAAPTVKNSAAVAEVR